METLTRRRILAATLALPFAGLLGKKRILPQKMAMTPPDTGTGTFKLDPLPYDFKALEPNIDTQTMMIHWGKHHATYVKNLNDAAAKEPKIADKSPEYLITHLDEVPEPIRMLVRNNAGGHFNHTLFWKTMKPRGGGEPTGALANDIKVTFGSFDNFKSAFNEAGTKRFGSGWVWLVKARDGKMSVVSTPNQDNPITDGQFPIMGNDVWEHAYYLKYQNKRADYLKAWWNTVNWEFVGDRYNKMGM